MIKVSGERDQVNIAKVYKARQEHILRFWDELEYESRKKLLAQIDQIDFQLVSRLAKRLGTKAQESPARVLEKAPVIHLPSTAQEQSERMEALKQAQEALRAGRVALLMVAGGQASRLGFDRPKGEFGIGPVTNKCLFQLFAEKITALRMRYATQLPWYIMTSESTDEQTRQFFEQHNYFNMPRSRTIFFKQRMLPAVDRRGKILLAQKDEIFMSPNGHGGSLLALKESECLDRMEEEGTDLLFYFQVDNPLAVIADPVMIGYHLSEQAEITCKGVMKNYPSEKVGVFAKTGGKTVIVEYNELSKEEEERKDEQGELVFGFGNIAVHVFSTSFLQRILAGEHKLPYHTSLRKVPYVDKSGRRIQPRKPNANKFETFVFDTLDFSEKTAVLEVRREEEFAPVKSSTGIDTPENAVRLLTNMWGRWLAGCGVDVPFDKDGNVKGVIEISPLYALDTDELTENVKPGTRFTGHLCLEP